MDLVTAQRDTERALEQWRDRLREATEQEAQWSDRKREATEQVESLEAEYRGLTLAVARHGGMPPPSVAPVSEEENWAEMTRGAAILKMLAREARPLGPAELTHLLVAAGRTQDKPHYIASTLDNLKKRNRVLNPSHGNWVLPDGAQPNGSEPATKVTTGLLPGGNFPTP
jgi:hypothetical protein